MRAAVVLSRLLAGRNQVIRLRKLIREIESAVKTEFDAGRLSATEVQSTSKLIAAAYEQLAEADRKRHARSNHSIEAEQQKLLAESTAPFPAPEGCQWFPPRQLTDGKAVWLLVAPVLFQVIDRRTFNEKIKSRSVGSQSEPAA